MAIRDGGWTLVDWDALTGRSTWSTYDGEKTVYRIDYPVENIVKHNREEALATDPGWKGDWHKVASIPLNVYHDSGMFDAIGQKDARFMSRWLNDSDNRAWRTKEGMA